ncbi:MAG: hypothetical protein Q7K42_04500, partial [Candidatus Diapherotrites archaeon]|nr:hypothetical protein [Candidatus Diapherotrites archaeon]
DEISAVSLPSKERLVSSNDKSYEKSELKKYFFELDECVYKSGLQPELLRSLENYYYFNERFFTADKISESGFFKNSFKILKTIPLTESNRIVVDELRELDANRIVLRGKINQEEFYDKKKKIESQIEKGSKKLHVFFDEPVKGQIIIAERIQN